MPGPAGDRVGPRPRDVLHVGQDTHGEEEEGGVPRDMEGVEEGIVGQVERWQDVGLGGEQDQVSNLGRAFTRVEVCRRAYSL